MLINKKIKFAILFFLVFVLTGCQAFSASDGLKIINDNLGKVLNSLGENQASSTFNFFGKSASTTAASVTAADLTAAQKQSIDNWLAKRGLNRYGDSPNAVYTGGTPLFNEATGKAIERYDYILNKFPDILDLIKEGK
ncbi:MAG TPA: hypothetical protein VMC41_00390 [Candidatus Nanoarchaeia archaeon]|nr:hypothetical protein [Candidatus Nanoarchaeia archaeon]